MKEVITIGVILITALALAVATIIFELKVVKSSSFLTTLVRRGAIFGLMFSLAISWFIGLLFGATGLIVMIAAMVSTPVTEFVYSFKRTSSAKTSKMKETLEELKATWMWLFKLIKYVFLIVTSPIWIPMKIRRWYLNKHEFVTANEYVRADDYTVAA